MTDDCFWSFEGCPEDQDNFTGETGGAGGEKMMHDGGFGLTIVPDGMVHPVAGNLAFLSLSAVMTGYSYMKIFRWNYQIDNNEDPWKYWDDLKLGDFNWMYWANLVGDYANLGLYGFGFLFQLIATFGAGTGFNRAYWIYGVIAGKALVSIFIWIAFAIAKERTYNSTNDYLETDDGQITL